MHFFLGNELFEREGMPLPRGLFVLHTVGFLPPCFMLEDPADGGGFVIMLERPSCLGSNTLGSSMLEQIRLDTL